ncbi:MAG: DUF4232 domain-containing protein [Acidimicrobiales bacterium]
MTATFTIIPGSAGAGHVEGRIVLVNVGTNPCRTGGYVGVQLLGASDTPLPTKVVRDTGTPVTTIVVPAGGAASALVRFSPDVPGPGDNPGPSCQPVASGSEITPPNDTSFVIAHGPQSSVCEQGTLEVRALQAGGNAGA